MLFTTTKVVILLSIIYQSWGNINVALNKPAIQSSTLGANAANRAVNGQTNDFSHTEPDGLSKWWTVDLLARYSIESITLYNRPGFEYRLAKISILTSTVLSPADPSLTHSNWTTRNYREEAYGSSGTVSFNPPIRAQHVAVYMESRDVPLTLAEVKIYGVAVNLALNKPARQISNYSSAYLAGKAVNGNINDFSNTAGGTGNKWWTVDLQARYSIETITLYNRRDRVDLQPNLAKIYILTSTQPNPAAPLPGSPNWIGQNYRAEAYGSNDAVPFDPPIEAIHVAIYLENFDTPLVLAEVQVYGDYNHASGKTANQSSTYGGQNRSDLAADKAVDGDFSTNSITNFQYQPNNAWWKVDLVDRILLGEVTVYVRDGLCGSGNAEVDCSSRLSDVYFLTNYRDAGDAPNTDGVADWSICYHSVAALGDSYTVQCDTGYQNPVTRLFSIRTNNGISVELREVYVFAYELPALSGDIAITAEGITANSITITFSQWTQQMTGGLPPTQYTVQLSGGQSKTVPHDTSSQRLSATFNGLDAGQTYTFTVSCTIQGIACIGSTSSTTASTSCAVPDAPGAISQESAIKRTHSSRQRWRYTVTWLAPNKANCGGVLQYSYGLSGQPLSVPQLQRRATFYVEGTVQFVFVVTANNSVGFSGNTTFSGTSGVLKPQFTAGQSSVTGKSSACVTFTWETPTYPGGTITQYQCQCDGEQKQTLGDGIRSKDSCNHEPNTEVTCTVWATNSAGDGSIQNSGKTLCAVPSAPRDLTISTPTKTNTAIIQWEFNATWMEPIKPNCDGTIQYKFGIQGVTNSTLQSRMRNTFYLHGDKPYNFVVKAKNSNGFSSLLSEVGRSPPLEPQFGDSQFTLVATNSSCLTLSWQIPQYPGGNVSAYQYQCGVSEPQQSGAEVSTGYSCGYNPNTEVTCKLIARNEARNSTEQVKSATTDCSDPMFTQEPTYTDVYDEATDKRVVSIIVDTGRITINCDTLQNLQYRRGSNGLTEQSTFRGLKALTTYDFIIRAVNNKPFATNIQIAVTTGETKPDDGPVVNLNKTNSTCVFAGWSDPLMPNGDIVEYRHTCTKKDAAFSEWTTTEENSLTDCEYEAGDIVTCDIQASTSKGYGPSTTIDVKVTCANPSPPVFTLNNSLEGNKTTVNLVITLWDSKSYCQYITEYTINVAHPDGSLVHNETTTTNGSYIISNLYGFTNYTVTVEAVNNEGRRSESTLHVVTVETHVPEEPGIQEKSTDVECATLNASEPTKPNGLILSYLITCTDGTSSKFITSSQPQATLCGFPSATQIYCSVAAINSIGIGRPQNTSIYTQLKITNLEDAQPTVPDQPKKSKNLIVTIKINPIEVENTEVRKYIAMMSKVTVRKKRSDTNPCPECYIAAEIPANEVVEGYEFDIGDGNTDEKGNMNRPLDEQSVYKLYLGVMVTLSNGYEPLVKYLDPVNITTPKLVAVNDGEIAGAFVGVVIFLALACVAGFVVWRIRNQSGEEKDKGFTDIVELPDINTEAPEPLSPAPIPAPTANEVDEADVVYDNPWGQSEAIPVDKLEWYINTNTETIKTQYEEFKKLPTPNMSVAQLTENKGKCRYKRLYPSDLHRVHLQRSGEGETDFINASFMKGYARDVQYIAAQGPFTEALVEDFWLMIWQQRPSAIVMVTRAIESTKMKCMQYWPLQTGVVATHGEFKVSLKSTDMFSDFSFNHLEVTKNGETRVILHFNYLYWPDHGVPDIEVFVSFHRLITSTVNRNQKQPLLVHCSAGVGRTGTYIALDYLLEQANREKKVDIIECVKQMRTRRPCMIQTVEQYVLLHQALYESLETENFSCMPPDFDSKFLKNSQHTASSSGAISVEYTHATTRAGSLNLTFTLAKLPENQDKNRYSEILPADSVMPYLMGGTKGNYINAVIVDGYKEKKQWIATQLPLSNTIADFWQLILEQDIKIIVQLEGGQKPFYPIKDGANMTIEQFVIKRTDCTTGDVQKVINLQLETEDESRTVQVVVPNNWISETLPTTDIIISLQEAAEKIQQQTCSRNMCVTCLDGSSRCGLFICAYNAIEKLKAEQVVDLYYATVMAKLRRPQFIPTIEQYGYLYQVLKDYLNAFGEYANFR